jgi:polyferredoxin
MTAQAETDRTLPVLPSLTALPGFIDIDTLPRDDGPQPQGRNLLDIPLVRAIARSRLYPQILQIPAAALFGLIAFQLLAGPSSAHANAGTAWMWVLWWPILPVVFVFLGRFWCAICPFGAISDAVQKLVGVNRPVPAFLKKYGIWIIDAWFIAITWADHVWGIVESPWGSGVLLLMMTTAVIVSGAFFARRTFCRYLCFLGGMAGNYARTGIVALRTKADVCATCSAKAACFNGTDTVAPCPLFTFPRTMDSNAACNLCANCIKSCPNDAITLSVRKPTSELWFIRKPKVEESFLAMAIMGIVLIQNITMLAVWKDSLGWLEMTTGITNKAVIFTAAFSVAILTPVALLVGAAWIARHRTPETTWQNFARFGYALIPLDIAGHVAHNLFHFFGEGKAIVYTTGELVGIPSPGGSTALLGGGAILAVQFALLGLGIAASLYAVRRIAHKRYQSPRNLRWTLVPFGALIALFGVMNVGLFLLPMGHRM